MLKYQIKIHAGEESSSFEFARPLVRRAARYALKSERPPFGCRIDIALILDEEMRKINFRERNVDKTTDVLSFPALTKIKGTTSFADPMFDPDTGRVFLGDILLSPCRAEKQAAEYKHTLERELSYLTVHGVLHLLGLDHKTDFERAFMREREKCIMERIGVFK